MSVYQMRPELTHPAQKGTAPFRFLPSRLPAMTSQRIRLAIVSTPRTGNTWLRMMLAHVYGIEHQARLCIPDHEWETFPENLLLQIHWGREQEFADKLRQHGFRVLTLARHPFDV